jgi:hypothetical protein
VIYGVSLPITAPLALNILLLLAVLVVVAIRAEAVAAVE